MVRAALGVLSLAVALIGASVAPPRSTRFRQTPTPPNVSVLKALGASQRALVTDLIWIRAIAVSATMRDPADGLALIQWCGVVADLDPSFSWAYLVGGLLGHMTYGDKQFNVEPAAALLERGTRALPNDHRFAVYLAYNQLMLQQQPLAAAATLMRGSRAPNAPAFLAQLATRLYSQEGRFDVARDFARQLSEAQDPETREFFSHRLLEIARDEELARVRDAVERYSAAKLAVPPSLEALVAEGFLRSLPFDPLGGRFRLDPVTGAVSASSGEELKQKVPVDP